MIYRLKSSGGSIEGMNFSTTRPSPPYGLREFPSAYEYNTLFEELPVDPPWPHCRLFKAPILPEWRIKQDLIVEMEQGLLPDFMVLGTIYITHLVKSIIEKHDPFGHQFWPVKLIDEQGNLATEKTYYRMNMRRYASIDSTKLPWQELDFAPSSREGGYISTIQHNLTVREHMETLPLWRHITADDSIINDYVLYINHSLMTELQAAGVTGIKEYSETEGKPGETVGHV